MPVNFTQFLSAETFTDEDWFVGYRGEPSPGKERRWQFNNLGTPPAGDTEPTNPNEGGSDSTFFIMADGSLRFCGNNLHNHGGIGTIADVVVVPRPVAFNPPLQNKEKVTKVYIQKYSSYAITDKGSLYGCGYNSHYQLGLNHNDNVPVFTRIIKSTNDGLDTATVLTPVGDKVVAMSPGCGNGVSKLTPFAITDQGYVWTWGYNGATNSRTGLGDTTSTYIATPQLVSIGLIPGDPVVQVSAGGHSGTQVCFVRTQSGKIRSIGEGASGAVGSGSSADVKEFTEPSGLPAGYVATHVICTGEVNKLSTWILLNNGDVYATGLNDDKQVNPNNAASTQYAFSKITALSNISKLVMHSDTNRSTIWALQGPPGAYTSLVGWGDNSNGQLGLGNTTAQSSPIAPTHQPYFAGGKTIKDILVGGNDGKKATVIIDSDGKLWATGYGATGLIGDGQKTNTNTFTNCLVNHQSGKPKKLRSGGNGVGDPPKAYFMCLMDTGKLFAWGYDATTVAQLAVDTSPRSVLVPSPVMLLL